MARRVEVWSKVSQLFSVRASFRLYRLWNDINCDLYVKNSAFLSVVPLNMCLYQQTKGLTLVRILKL